MADILNGVVDNTGNTSDDRIAVSALRRVALYGAELLVLVFCCLSILHVVDMHESPSWLFAVSIGGGLFVANAVCGTYYQKAYVHHVSRFLRSAIAHLLVFVVFTLPNVVWFQDSASAIYYVLGMVIMSFFVSNTLRPVLVEVLRAGNKFDQRRQPGSSSAVS